MFTLKVEHHDLELLNEAIELSLRKKKEIILDFNEAIFDEDNSEEVKKILAIRCNTIRKDCSDLQKVKNKIEQKLRAYESHIEFEKEFNNPDNPYLRMGFKKFCKEMDKGYGQSNWNQIARLYEAPDGKIYYDNEYY